MFEANIERTGNVYRRQTGVESVLKISYMGDFPCTGQNICKGWGAANHFDGSTPYEWVRKAAETPELWHRKSDSAYLDLPLSQANYEFAVKKLQEFAKVPVKGYTAAEVRERGERADLVIRSIEPRRT